MKTVVISILGVSKDKKGKGEKRWEKWRPTISMFQHDDLMIDRLDLLCDNHSSALAKHVSKDIELVSPQSMVNIHTVNFKSPWDFESVYSTLLDFARAYPFKPDTERYLIHITTGTHVAQICLYLLTEAGYLPGELLQTSPPQDASQTGTYQIINLDLSKYDQIASRFNKEHQEGTDYLKNGIQTRNAVFNSMIEQLEKISIRSAEPILITGPTGAGKSQLAQKIYSLRKQRGLINGDLVIVNCATLRGDNAMSALFGHKKGAFTGAQQERLGLLKSADKGLLFLDEIAELGLDEQAMLLRAIEEKSFLPVGADREVTSQFQLIAGTNHSLVESVQLGIFRADLLARIDLWSYQLPSLKERPEDFEANIEFELEKFSRKSGTLVGFNSASKARYLSFAQSSEALWAANFRDLNASITRMATLADGGRITEAGVREEIERLKLKWKLTTQPPSEELDTSAIIDEILGAGSAIQMDLYERASLACLLRVCQQSHSMAEAGRKLFHISRSIKKSTNDSHRVKQLLAKYNLTFDEVRKELV